MYVFYFFILLLFTFSRQFVYYILNIACPFGWLARAIESLPWYGLANVYGEMLANIAVHLVDQEYHGEIERQEAVAEVGYAIETIGVLSAEMYWNNVALALHALHYECLLPIDVVYRSVLLSAAVKSGREHKHMTVAPESRLHHARKVASVAPGLVDAYTYWSQSRQIHEQVVDKIAEPPVVVASYNGAERYAILSSERMI